MARLGGLVNVSVDRLGLRQKITEQQALAHWSEIVGPQIAASTVAERVREGILFICCKSSMWSNELSLHKDDIMKRLNAAVGKNTITDIHFTARGFRKATASKPEEELYGKVKDLEAVELGEADVELAIRVASASPSEELAEKIQRAVLTSKRREQIQRSQDLK